MNTLTTISVRRFSSKFFRAAESVPKNEEGSGEFRVLNLRKFPPFKRRSKWNDFVPALPPRYLKQKVDQDWGNVWPVPRSFHPAAVPLPLRMGVPPFKPKAKKPKPDKWANLELMKIPNFLHLTPPVIKRQSEALKKFCTEWPAGLETKEKQTKHFPVTITTSSYLHSTTTIRDERARIVTLTVNLKSLALDHHGQDKMLRLVGERYNDSNDELTIVADRCPLSCQNMDYCYYLLTVLFNESMKTEPWENEREVSDYELYKWEESPSYKTFQALANYKDTTITETVANQYRTCVTKLHNEGEDTEAIEEYRDSVLQLIGIANSPESSKVETV